MSDYKEEIDEFAPAQPAQLAASSQPAQPAQPAAPAQPAQPAAPAQPAQPAQPAASVNAYDSIISQQTEQIDALIAQNQSLTNQITKLLQNGAQINAQPAASTQQALNMKQQLANMSLQESDDWSLEALAKDIGKKHR